MDLFELTKHGESPCQYRLSGEVNIYSALELRSKLLNLSRECKVLDRELELDLAGISEIDTAGLQILLALKRSYETQDKEKKSRVLYTGHSQPVVKLIELLGLAEDFGDPLWLRSN